MNYLIAGYGKFGRLAAERIRQAFPAAGIIVVEQNPAKLPHSIPDHVTAFNDDAVSFMLNSKPLDGQDWIVPMVPFHLAATYLLQKSSTLKLIPFPLEVSLFVPNPYPSGQSDLCCSVADFLCPDDCPEGLCCTVTGQPRSPLHKTLEELHIPEFKVSVLRSSQILPGVGGYALADLLDLENQITSGQHIIATSCRCHAIMTAYAAE
ncbi:MAG: hypothetical protein HY913_11785 [Desulfomonile tiedjei]|nr:hypothetical protein [Desulfomonile tiedjei]